MTKGTRTFLFAVTFMLGGLTGNAAFELEAKELRPPRDVIPVESTHSGLHFYWLAGSVLSLGIAVIFYRMVRSRPLPSASAYVRAYRDLEIVRETNDPGSVWHIIRTYLLESFKLRRKGVTPDELLQEVDKGISLPPRVRAEMKLLFEQCDVAQFSPDTKATGDLADQALALLNSLEAQAARKLVTVPSP